MNNITETVEGDKYIYSRKEKKLTIIKAVRIEEVTGEEALKIYKSVSGWK